MEMWQYIEILKQPNKFWLSSIENSEKKLKALSIIGREAHSNWISSLIEFLKDRNVEVRQKTCDTIIHLFKKIESKNQSYNSLKNCNISINDIYFYKKNFSKENFIELLGVC